MNLGGILGLALRCGTNLSPELSPSDWGIFITVSIMGLRGVLKLGVSLSTAVLLQAPTCVGGVLGMDACSSASAIPQFLWTNGIYMVD